uniref:cysteine--tRNA ligase n=1 Tax=Cacopsylla melanoneura TaxID=428564 RepID=A0A8D8WQI0_9HEMI
MNQAQTFLLNLKYLTLLAKCSFLSQTTLVAAYSTTSEPSKWSLPTGYDTGIKVYNPITKSKVPFVIQDKNHLKWYACGPTVYDSPHIGHAVCNVKLDIIRRIMQNYFNIHSVVVSSVTDIDDKIIAKANSIKEDYKTVAKKYELEYLEAMDKFDIIPPTRFTRVSEFIPHIQDFIKHLIDTKQAYIGADNSVYFDVDAFPHYYKLWGKVDSSAKHPIKKSQLDFALWKVAKEGEPWFESVWSKGRPGWHIECSAMASQFFGSKVDLHTGGIDLKFPHHENEEAQSCAYHNTSQWVNYWLHTGHLRGRDGTKMSKSLGNFVTVKDFLKTHSPSQLRMMCLLSSYGADMDYNEETLSNARQVLERFRNFVTDCDNYMKQNIQHGNVNTAQLIETMEESKRRVYEALRDDFSTNRALDTMLYLMSMTNSQLHNSSSEHTTPNTLLTLSAVSHFISNTLSSFGLHLSPSVKTSSDGLGTKVNAVLDSAVKFRTQVRKIAIDLKKTKVDAGPVLTKCDEFRDEMAALGIQIKDQKAQATWQFKEGANETHS